jgi:hypothetical protein
VEKDPLLIQHDGEEGALSTSMQCQMNHIGHSLGFREVYVPLLLGCGFTPVSSRLANRLIADQFDATVFGVHFGSCEGDARVSDNVFCMSLTSVLYVLWFFRPRCGSPLYKFSPIFSQ